MIQSLGFHGRVNHYAGALGFYELCPSGFTHAAGTITFTGTPEMGKATTVTIAGSPIAHLNLTGDTAETMAKCFEFLINAGSSSVRAQAAGAVLTLTARALGTDGNGLSLAAATNSSQFAAQASAALSGGADGKWLTDLAALPRLNRACRDWSAGLFQALKGYGIEATVAFSMELGNGDESPETGIAQRYPDGSPCRLNTPALQTNFGPASTRYWQQVYVEMAAIVPYLQFGEVQWWYFAGESGMPFYDANTTSGFQAQYGRAMAVIASENADPAAYPDECEFLADSIGKFTQNIRNTVRQAQPATRFEVLYPTDVNNTPLNQLANFPAGDWTAANLACLKTENFTYTGNRDLKHVLESIQAPAIRGFPASQSSHLVGISDCTSPWGKERALAIAAGVESVVLFALDQFCLIGYPLPLDRRLRRSRYAGR